MLILGLHTGHNATAALYEDYKIIAAVHLERLTRRKIDGGRVPNESINECLHIAGARRSDIDVVVLGRGKFPSHLYTHTGKCKRFVDQKMHPLLFGKEKRRWMPQELYRAGHIDSLAIFDTCQFRKEFGLSPKTELQFYNHHFAHALPTLFHTDWNEALLYTSDGGGDSVQYSHRIFQNESIETIYGGDESLLQKPRVDSLGLAYGYATKALGYKINQHDGKSDLRRIPEWVAQHIKRTDETCLDTGSRPSKWLTDKDLFHSGVAPDDDSYKNSEFDRGHMAAKLLAARISEAAEWNTHTVLNAVPQRPRFNQQIWRELENLTGAWAQIYGEIWVIQVPEFDTKAQPFHTELATIATILFSVYQYVGTKQVTGKNKRLVWLDRVFEWARGKSLDRKILINWQQSGVS